MDLKLPIDGLSGYKSPSQIARIMTEEWAKRNIYCPACSSPNLANAPTNTQAVDFFCPKCKAPFQLKARRACIGKQIPDASYDSMMRALSENKFPHLFILQYDYVNAIVNNLILIPRFGIPASAIQQRRPLASSARRAGWVGCNILLFQIPPEARISLITAKNVIPSHVVRRQYEAMVPFANLPPEMRGWTLDVMTVLRSLHKAEFTLGDAYRFDTILAGMHPANRNIRPKIRQQLQVLRDLGYLEFMGQGEYRWTNK